MGVWISKQRNLGKDNKLFFNKRELLLKIGMRFENKNGSLLWKEMYKYAKVYHDHYGNLDVPYLFITNDGVTNDNTGKINLGVWLSKQRCNKELEQSKKDLLLKLGVKFEYKINILSWEEMYGYAKKYYEHNGDLDIPYRFKTNDGYTYREDGKINLGTWIKRQRKKEKNDKLELYKRELLLKIGMMFDNKNSTLSWDEMYEYAKKYFEYNKNLKVPHSFKTNDGISYVKDGKVNLGFWVSNQRNNYKNDKMKSDKIQLLNSVGMIWDVKENKEKIENICIEYDIDIKVNNSILEHISIQELSSKISYLLNNNISIVDSDGNLHDLFSMSSINMQAKYNVSLEDLINKYYISDTESRGK